MNGDHNPTAASSSSSAPPPQWIELPWDVTANILHRLGPMEILKSAQLVCTTWRSICSNPSLWRVIDMISYGENDVYPIEEIVCRHAVDHSQGELIHISIELFGTDELLQYISNRSSQLKSIRLTFCDISVSGLTTAVGNFPLLEELHLFFMPSIGTGDIETIAVSCPLLKSFTFNKRDDISMEIDDSIALAIWAECVRANKRAADCEWEDLIFIEDEADNDIGWADPIDNQYFDYDYCYDSTEYCDDFDGTCMIVHL